MSEWALALEHMGHSAKQWNKNEKPLFDAFDENQPDIFITAVSDLTAGQIRCLKEFDETKLVAQEDSELESTTNNLDLSRIDLFFNIHEKNFDFYAKSVYLPHATNWPILAERMQGVLSSPDYQCDISIICNYDEEIEKYINLLLNTQYRLRIYGANWEIPQCVGRIPWEDRFVVYMSSRIMLDFSSEISQTYLDAAACGGFPLSKRVDQFESKEKLKNLIDYFMENPHEYNDVRESYQKYILERDTYQNRMEKLLGALA